MNKSEFQKKLREIDAKLELDIYEKERRRQLEVEYENRTSNRNRARSVTVGTAFGGTTELGMRMDAGKSVWCVMQPVEVIELIHQLSANVGCTAQLTPRKDFASWRDWRVSEAEKKHLNGHAPFVNDMAVFHQLGASGYNDEEAKRIMDIVANTKEYANEGREDKVYWRDNPNGAGPNVMLTEEDGSVINKLIVENNEVVYTAGGNGAIPGPGKQEFENGKNTLATEKTVNKRITKRAARASR